MRFFVRKTALYICLISSCLALLSSVPSVNAGKKGRFYFENKGYASWQVQTTKKQVALTFDDGPDPRYTPQILEVLNEYDAKATFFLIGSKVKEYPEIVRQTYLLGHELGNHTYSHQHIEHLSQSALTKELDETTKAVQSITGEAPKFFRPPRGFYDEPTMLTANHLGYHEVLWSWDEDSRDWEGPGVEKIIKTVVGHVHPGDIILFHDGTGKSKQTVRALKEILPQLKREGYECVTLSTLIGNRQTHDTQDEDDDCD